MKPKVMIIEACDFNGFPMGGQLSHALHLVQVFGDRLALVGVSTDDTPVGAWTKKKVAGIVFDYFSVGRVDSSVKKPLIPRRLDAFLRLKYYKRQILSLGVDCAYVLAPEVMIAISRWGLRICYSFSGVENPLAMPRYRFGKLLAAPFEKLLFSSLANHTELIIAAADKNAIEKMLSRSQGLLNSSKIIQFHTSVDTTIFNIDRGTRDDVQPVFISCGRLNHVKGWDLILQAFIKVKNKLPLAHLYFLGDGEDRNILEAQIAEAGLQSAVIVKGFVDQVTVASLLNASKVFVLGSHREGWPTAILEAMACGLPVVSTRVSSVGDLIEEGSNGYVVATRNPEEFAAKMLAALELENPNYVSFAIAQRYALDKLGSELKALWKPFRD